MSDKEILQCAEGDRIRKTNAQNFHLCVHAIQRKTKVDID